MLLEYIEAALRHAKYEILSADGTYYGEIPECNGVYSNADTLEECREELREVLEEWVLFRVHRAVRTATKWRLQAPASRTTLGFASTIVLRRGPDVAPGFLAQGATKPKFRSHIPKKSSRDDKDLRVRSTESYRYPS